MNLHEIPFHLLTITEHSSLGLSCCSTSCVAFQFSSDTERLTARLWLEQLASGGCLPVCLSHGSLVLSWPFHSQRSEKGSTVGRVAKGGWTMEESILWRVSALACKCILCMGVIVEGRKATMCFFKWVRWLWKPLSRFLEAGPSHWHTLLLAAGHCSTWIQLQSLFGKVLS